MSLPNFADAPPLLTHDDVLERVRALVGPAAANRQLWIMFVDGDGRQTPVVMPVSDLPRNPGPGGLPGLSAVLAELREDLATDLGPGSVILTYERFGAAPVRPADLAWGEALTGACAEAGVALRGVFLSTDGGVRPLAAT